jgi:hypothetical protein
VRHLFPTASLLYRNRLSYPDFYLKVGAGDIALYAFNADLGKIRYFPEVMAVYRHHPGGASKHNARKQEAMLQNRIYFLENFNIFTARRHRRHIAAAVIHFLRRLLTHYRSRRQWFRFALNALRLLGLRFFSHPSRLHRDLRFLLRTAAKP